MSTTHRAPIRNPIRRSPRCGTCGCNTTIETSTRCPCNAVRQDRTFSRNFRVASYRTQRPSGGADSDTTTRGRSGRMVDALATAASIRPGTQDAKSTFTRSSGCNGERIRELGESGSHGRLFCESARGGVQPRQTNHGHLIFRHGALLDKLSQYFRVRMLSRFGLLRRKIAHPPFLTQPFHRL